MADEKYLDMRELGSTGLKRFSGYVYEEDLRDLQGAKGIKAYKGMSNNDPTVGAILFAIKMLARQVNWRVQGASEQSYDVEAKEYLESCMDDMEDTWIDTVDSDLSMLVYGNALSEIVYKKRLGDSEDPSERSKFNDGRIGWRKLPIRAQDTIYKWIFDDNGGIIGAEQLAPPHYNVITIPNEKMLLFRTTLDKNDPNGKSILRNAYTSHYMKNGIQNVEAIGVERDLAGLPVALVPPEILSAGATTEQKTLLSEIKKIIVNIRRDAQEGVVFPSAYDENGKLMFELKLLSTGGSRQFDVNAIIQRYDHRIAMSVLADFVLIGQAAVGSFALTSTKTELFADAIGAFLDIIADVMNRYAVPRLFDLNDFKISDYPKIVHGDIESADLAALGAYIRELAGAGMPLFPNPELEKYLMKAGSLPEPPDYMMPEPKVKTRDKNKRTITEIQADETIQSTEEILNYPGDLI